MSATANPMTMIAAKISRRISLSRVVATRRQLAAGDRGAEPLAAPRRACGRRPRPPRRRRARHATAAIHSAVSTAQLCRTPLPAWRTKLPPHGRAQSPPRVAPRRSAWRGGSLGRPAWRCSLVADLRRALLRSCGRRAGRGEREQVRRPGPDPRAGGSAALAARSLGRGLVPAHRRLGLRRRATRAPPSSRSTRCWCAPSRRRSGARRRRCWWPPTWWRWPPSSVRSSLLYRLVSLELGRPLARPRCCCWRCSRPRCSSARPTPRACSCCWRWARSTPRAPTAGRGPGACAAGAAAHAQRRHPAARAAGRCSGGALRGGRARRRAGCARRRSAWARMRSSSAWPRATRCASSTSRRPGRASSPCPLSGAWDGAHRGLRRAAPAGSRARRRSSTSRWRRAIPTGSPRST